MVGTQLALSDALRPGAQGHPGVCRGSPSGLLPLQGLPAGRPQGSDQGVGDRNGGQPRGGHSGSLLRPSAEPLPPLVEFHLLQDAVSHQPMPEPQRSQPAAKQNQGGMNRDEPSSCWM